MYKLIIFGLSLFLVLGFGACKKPINPGQEVPSTPGKFGEIKTDPNFNWNTQMEIVLNINGLKTDFPIRNTLQVTDKPKTSIYHTGSYLMEENLSLKLQVPIALDSIRFKFGSIEKTYKVSKTIESDYIINYPEETE